MIVFQYQLFYYLIFITNVYAFGLLGKLLNQPFIKNRKNIIFNINSTIDEKKVITISPGGFRGFYMLGLCKYLKENYELEDYVFSGASAGAWNSLFLSLKEDDESFINYIFDIDYKNVKNLELIEENVKKAVLNNYKTDDFKLDKVYVGTTVWKKFKFRTVIYNDFYDLEDAINCCIGSSHIPFITGNLFYKYRNLLTFDGGFSKYPYIDGKYADVHITPSYWEDRKKNKLSQPANLNIRDYTTLFTKKDHDLKIMYIHGYEDAKKNKKILDSLFPRKNNKK
tara:strand:- start:774 stop:1619 length:846 start_codon:yes stop_codon:yes gene_type:complete